MSTRIFTYAMRFTNLILFIITFFVLANFFLAGIARADWTVDFSRRLKSSREVELKDARTQPTSTHGERDPASVGSESASEVKSPGLLDALFDSGEPVQDLVILNTDHGFVPSTVRVRKNGRYRIHVVNVNEKEKNVSFILDGFSEHHATYYGKIKVFTLEPKKEGTYSFQSPETSSEGKLVVFQPQLQFRAPAQAAGEEK